MVMRRFLIAFGVMGVASLIATNVVQILDRRTLESEILDARTAAQSTSGEYQQRLNELAMKGDALDHRLQVQASEDAATIRSLQAQITAMQSSTAQLYQSMVSLLNTLATNPATTCPYTPAALHVAFQQLDLQEQQQIKATEADFANRGVSESGGLQQAIDAIRQQYDLQRQFLRAECPGD